MRTRRCKYVVTKYRFISDIIVLLINGVLLRKEARAFTFDDWVAVLTRAYTLKIGKYCTIIFNQKLNAHYSIKPMLIIFHYSLFHHN